jgi:hypothetical protein
MAVCDRLPDRHYFLPGSMDVHAPRVTQVVERL